MNKLFRIQLMALLFIAGQNIVWAQPFNLDERINPKKLELKEYKKADTVKGQINITEVTQKQDTSYYFVKGFSMYSPTYFGINTTDPDADIKINLCQENWQSIHRTGTLKGKGIWKSQFKVEDDFGIMIIANKKPVRYVLTIWSGIEMKIDMPSVFKDADDTATKGGGWFKKNMTLVIIGIVALIIILFLLFKLKNKKQ